MADQIVSWGGFNSKGMVGMGITGSLSLIGDLNFQPGATRYISMSASPTTTSGNSIVIQAGDATTSGVGGSVSIQPGGGAGGPGGGTVIIGNTSWWNGATVNGILTVTNSGPNTGTALTVNAGGQVAMRWDWDNINNVTSVVSTAGRTLRFTGASQYQVRGSGTTSSTTAFLVQNANANDMVSLTDNGTLTVNAFQTSSTAFTVKRTNGTLGGGFNAATMGSLIAIDDSVGNSNASKTSLYINTTGASTNNALVVENGGVGFGTTAPGAGFTSAYFTTLAGLRVNLASTYTITAADTRQLFNTTSGGGISFRGDASGQGTGLTAYAGIRGLKANNSYVNPLGNLVFYVQTGSSSHIMDETTFNEVARFNSSGYLGIGTSTPSSSLHISGSSNSALFKIDSPAVNNIIYVSGSGRVGIGTGTPAYTLDTQGSGRFTSGVVVTAGQRISLGGSDYGSDALYSVGGAPLDIKAYYYTRFTKENTSLGIQVIQVDGQALIKGSGTTSATTSLLVQNSAAATSMAILDDGKVGIGTSAPTSKLQVLGGTLSGTVSVLLVDITQANTLAPSNSVPFGLRVSGTYTDNNTANNTIFNPFFDVSTLISSTVASLASPTRNLTNISPSINVGTSDIGTTRILNIGSSFTARHLNNLTGIYYNPTFALSGALTNHNAIETVTGDVLFGTTSGRVGIGTSTPSSSLHISGSSNSALFKIDSPAVNNILYVSGSGNVGIGKSNPAYKLDVNGTINTGVGYGNFTTYSPDAQFGAAYVGEEVKVAIATARSNPATYAGVTVPGFSSALIFGTSYGYNIGTGNYIISVGDLNVRVNNTTQALYANTSGQIGVGFSGSLSARLDVKGSGATTSTKTLLLQNSNGTQLGYVDDSGRWQIGQGTNSGFALEVSGSAQITGNSGGYKLALKTTGGGNGAGLLVDQNGYTMLDVNASDVYMRSYPGNTSKLDFWCWTNYGGPTNVLFAQNSQYQISTNNPVGYKIPIVKFPDATVPIIMGNIATADIRGYLTVGGAFYASASLGASQRIVSTVNAIANDDTLIGLDILPTFSTGSYTGVTSLALRVSGSATISNILTLTPQSPLPSGVPTGSFAVSSSAPPKPYFYDGTTWNALY